MPIQYDFREQPGYTSEWEEKLLYPRIVVLKTVTADELIAKVAHRTTFTAGEVRGILQLMAETVTHCLSEGQSVELEELGFLTASLTSRPVKTKNEIRAASVSVNGVNFRPSKLLKEKLKSATLMRARFGFGKSSQKRTQKERKVLLENYFSKNTFITRTTYSELTGLLKDKALEDLNGWVKEGSLVAQGKRSTKIYMKPPIVNSENNAI